MSFIRFWIGFTMLGLGATVVLLIWAFKKRQFRESDRAGYLALSDVDGMDGVNELKEKPPAIRASRETFVMLGILGLGIVAMIITATMAMVLE